MKRAILALLLVLLPLASASGWRIMYKEQYYKLYHEQLYHRPDDTMELISYLEEAMKADFCNPLYALAKIENEVQWERYRYLFNMHVNLMLLDLYRQLGAKWDKQVAYFYNAPWKRQNLESLATAEQIYRVGYRYWEEAKKWSARAWAMRTVHLPKVQKWEDDNWRIETGDLDFEDILDENLAHLAKVRADFEKMDADTY